MLTTDTYLQYLGAAIKVVRLEKGWHQIDLATGADMERTYISEVETGKRNLPILHLVRISEALELPLSELIKRAEQLSA